MIPITVDNPFQILTFIVAPAILTNSSSILSLSTSNRFARVVDRSRTLSDKLKSSEELDPPQKLLYQKQLPVLSRRALFLVRALTSFYISVGGFSATALISTIGAAASVMHYTPVSNIIIIVALISGFIAIAGLVTGGTLLVKETWLAEHFLRMEMQLIENTF